MDTPLILTHRTAWQIYHAPLTKTVRRLSELPSLTLAGTSPRCVRATLIGYLTNLGINEAEAGPIHLGVPLKSGRSVRSNLVRHAFNPSLIPSHTLSITDSLRIVDPMLCLMQAASWMSFWELIEFGYELCGEYHGLDLLRPSIAPCAATNRNSTPAHLPDRNMVPIPYAPYGHSTRGPTTEKQTDSTVKGPFRSLIGIDDIERALAGELKRHRGSARLQYALRFIHEGSRSPMESGLAMLVCLPQSEGGLGIEDIEMNHRVYVSGGAKALTKSPYFEIDVYRKGSQRGTEYDGRDHVTDAQREHDAERRNTLEEMGYSYKVLTAGQFSNQLSLHRAMNAVARSFGIEPPTDKTFQVRQNELRKFIIRSWGRQDSDTLA